jgi:hypothetical protein
MKNFIFLPFLLVLPCFYTIEKLSLKRGGRVDNPLKSPKHGVLRCPPREAKGVDRYNIHAFFKPLGQVEGCE